MVDPKLDPEGVGALARALFRHCFLKIMICKQACQPDEISSLKLWEELYSTGPSSDDPISRQAPAFQAVSSEPITRYPATRRVLAYQQAKQRARNPTDIRALLVYEVSHGTEDVAESEGDGCESEASSKAHACRKCGGPVDYAKRQTLLERIEKGYRLWQLRSIRAADEIVGTHLTRDEVFKFTGYEVNFDRLKQKVIKPIYDQLESEVHDP